MTDEQDAVAAADARESAIEAMISTGMVTDREAAERLLPAPPQAPAPALSGPALIEARRAEALAAADEARKAAEERKQLVEGARALAARGIGITLDESWTDDEVLKEMGLVPPSDPIELRRFQQQADHDALMADPTRRAAFEREQVVDEFRRSYWGLAKRQRVERMSELSIDPATFVEPKQLGQSA